MAKKMGRREFVKESVRHGMTIAVGGKVLSYVFSSPYTLQAADKVDISVVTGADYVSITEKAVDLLGGIEMFVSKGSKVALLPNVQSRHPGCFTKPEILRAAIRMCQNAGAKEVNVPSWQVVKNWEDTGLAKVIEEEGATLKLFEMDGAYFAAVPVPDGKTLKEAQILKEFYENDVFINMPITKDHAGNKFTGTLKNLMGLNSRVNNRTFHKENWRTDSGAIEYLDQCIVDLNTVIKPVLNIVDATEFIITNGPMGPGEIIKPQKVVAGVDRVAVDSYCTTLWGLKAEDIFMIKQAFDHKLGEMDLGKVTIKEMLI